MRKFLLFTCCQILITWSFAQTITQKLQTAWQQFEADSQLRHAISSLYVINAKTGEVVFDKNSQVGLAPASTQKIITAATAFELLGKNYRYQTRFEVRNNTILYINPCGDPTFGSWRWDNTGINEIMDGFFKGMNDFKIKRFDDLMVNEDGWNSENIPDGWIWQDIGNYYGAGTSKLNWRENQLDLILQSGNKIGDSVKIIDIDPEGYSNTYFSFTKSEVTSGKSGSGDNAYFYFSLNGENPNKLRGTIPVNENKFRVSVTALHPDWEFLRLLTDTLWATHKITEDYASRSQYRKPLDTGTIFFTHYSPSLDSIIYWFLQKSINLYGEALIKTFAFEKKGFGATDSGVVIVKDFWKQKGLDEGELNIYDGSGLSPLNRVTTHAQVEVLKYAKTKDWFPYFYAALPTYNEMKMKSGSISDVKGFCGYQRSGDGNEYIFSFLVNNYNGRSSGVVNKMYKVLDVLK